MFVRGVRGSVTGDLQPPGDLIYACDRLGRHVMATRQATLAETDRRVGEAPEDCGIVLLGAQTESAFPVTQIEIPSFAAAHVTGISRDDAHDYASNIRDAGSPVSHTSLGESADRLAYCFGSDPLSDLVSLSESYAITDVLIPAPGTLGETARGIADELERLAELELDADLWISVGPGRDDWDRWDDPAEFAAVLDGVRAAGEWGVRLQREAVKDDVRRWSSVDKKDGRAGLGFEWVETGGGTEWVPGDDYDEVCAMLEMVRDGEVSQSQAAVELGTSARTIRRCIEDRPGRYGL